MGAAFGCRAVQQPQRWLHLTCLSLLRALVLVCSMNWKRHKTNWRQERQGEEGGRRRECVASITWSVTPQRRYQHKKFKHHQPLSSCCCCSPETRCNTRRRSSSSHIRPVAVQPRERGEGSASSASAAARGGGGGGAWATAACGAAHAEGHCTEQCDVGPCSRCATRNTWKKESVHGSV